MVVLCVWSAELVARGFLYSIGYQVVIGIAWLSISCVNLLYFN